MEIHSHLCICDEGFSFSSLINVFMHWKLHSGKNTWLSVVDSDRTVVASAPPTSCLCSRATTGYLQRPSVPLETAAYRRPQKYAMCSTPHIASQEAFLQVMRYAGEAFWRSLTLGTPACRVKHFKTNNCMLYWEPVNPLSSCRRTYFCLRFPKSGKLSSLLWRWAQISTCWPVRVLSGRSAGGFSSPASVPIQDSCKQTSRATLQEAYANQSQ